MISIKWLNALKALRIGSANSVVGGILGGQQDQLQNGIEARSASTASGTPKKPLTPYIRYANEQRPNLRKAYPDLKITQITSEIAKNWKSLDDHSKAKYVEEYQAEKPEYDKRREEYKLSLSEEEKEAIRKQRKENALRRLKQEKRAKIKELDRPKPPLSAYLLFLSQNDKYPELQRREKVKRLAADWKALPEDDKKIYLDISQGARRAFEERLESWEISQLKRGNYDLVRVKTVKKVERLVARNKSIDFHINWSPKNPSKYIRL